VVQALADQHKPISWGAGPGAAFQGKTLTRKVEDEAFLLFFKPKNTLGPEDLFREMVQEILELGQVEGQVALERQRCKTVLLQVAQFRRLVIFLGLPVRFK
jgi:hypothetical protein